MLSIESKSERYILDKKNPDMQKILRKLILSGKIRDLQANKNICNFEVALDSL